MPQKLWLTLLTLQAPQGADGKLFVNLEGQSGNIESIYTFYRNIKDSISGSSVNLQKLSLAKNSALPFEAIPDGDLPENSVVSGFEENSNDIILSSNADFYEFIISSKTLKELERMKAPKGDGKKKK